MRRLLNGAMKGRAGRNLFLAGALALSWGALTGRAQVGAAAANQDQQLQQQSSDNKAAAAQPAPAQSPSQAKPSGEASSVVPVTGKPANAADAAKIHWSGTITGGIQFIRGQTDADGVSLTGDAEYAGPDRGYRFEGIFMFAKVRTPITPPGTPEANVVNQTYTAQDHRAAFFTFFQDIRGPVFLVTRISAEHDVLQDIKVRMMDLTGIGFRLANSQRFQALVVPGVGGAYEDKPNIRDGWIFTPGVYQGASWHITRIWSVDQWFQYRVNATNSHDYTIDGSAGLTGLLGTSKLGFNLSYIYSYEGLVAAYGGSVVPSLPYHVLSQLTIGLRYKL